MLDVMEAAQRLVKVVTGETYGDGEIVMDIGKGTERDSDKVWVTGNWNKPMGDRLFNALERIGVEAEWYDSVEKCYDCGKLMESQPTHYGWQPSYLMDAECQYVCFDCLDTSNDEILEEFNYIDNAEKAIPDVLGKHLETWGWAPYNGVFENGWHPGQTDNPRLIFDKIKEKEPNLSVVFRLDETSQFYIRFTAWTKDRSEDEDE
jgi:hypothetical protein